MEVNHKKVIAVLDLPPRRAPKHVRESYVAAAKRWGAELLWIRHDLRPCHPFWQKMWVCGHVEKKCGPSHVLQLDNDMVIRSDCPSPFEIAPPDKFAMVTERQCAQNRLDNGGWQKRAHEIWAKRCSMEPAPTWMHPNGGLYLYGTEKFGRMFELIGQYIVQCCGMSDHATDESLIVNRLWNDHRDDITFLPGDFNISVLQASDWAGNPVMQSFIYHFIGASKRQLEKCRWQRLDPPELPFPGDKQSRQLIESWEYEPPATHDIGTIKRLECVANLLAVYPELVVSGEWSSEDIPADHADETHSAHLFLTRFLLRLGVNARRFQLRVKEDAHATPQPSGT
ncbi:MAG: hypothetical protein AAFV88_06535 [Planctomycetota bacterium]